MISIFPLENKIFETLENTTDADELKEKYAALGNEASLYALKVEAVLEAVSEVAPEKAVDVSRLATSKINEYCSRYTTKDELKELEDYGYTKNPQVVLVKEKEEAMSYFDNGLPVFLLKKDNTETEAKDFAEINKHAEEGGLFGTTQFACEKLEAMILEGEALLRG